MNHCSTSRLYAWFAMSCLLFGTTANADVLVLKNGDRITGDVKRIWDAEVAASVNRGNTDSTTAKVRAYSTLKMNDHRYIGDIESFREELGLDRTKERDLLKYSYNYLFTDNGFFTGDH